MWGAKCRVQYAYATDENASTNLEWFFIKESKKGKDIPIQFDNEAQAQAYIDERRHQDADNEDALNDANQNANDFSSGDYYRYEE